MYIKLKITSNDQENSRVTRTHQVLDRTYTEQHNIAGERDPTPPKNTEKLAAPAGFVSAHTQGEEADVNGF